MTKVYLRPLTLEDTVNIVRWRNLPSVRDYLYSQDELTEEQHVSYFHNVVEQGKCAQYIIVVNDDDIKSDIGTIFIKNIDHSNRKGEYGIFIGEEQARGKGYSKVATHEILRIAFQELNLNRVYLTVLNNNIFAIKAYQSQGFQIEGWLRQDYCRDGVYMNVLLMAVLRDDWMKKSDVKQR